MAKFKEAYQITKANEGGYHQGAGHNKYDYGGETFKGIARNMHPNWPGWAWVDNLKTRLKFPGVALQDARINKMVLDFYKKLFWDVNSLDAINYQLIANELFDTGVNMGPKIAAEFLQRAINYLNRDQRNFKNLIVDGQIGPATLATVNNLNQTDAGYLFDILNILQGSRYLDIIDRNESQEVFIRGWLNRINLMRNDKSN